MSTARTPLVAIIEKAGQTGQRLLLPYDDIEVAAKFMRDHDLFKFAERHFHDKGFPPLVQWFVKAKAGGPS